MLYKLFKEVEAAFTSAALRQNSIKAHIFTLQLGYAVLHHTATHTDVPSQHSAIARHTEIKELMED
jgi:hypothetical protein